MTATARRCNWRGVAAGARRQAPDRRSAEARRRDVIVRGHQPAHLSYVFVDGLVCGDVRGEHEARQVPIVRALLVLRHRVVGRRQPAEDPVFCYQVATDRLRGSPPANAHWRHLNPPPISYTHPDKTDNRTLSVFVRGLSRIPPRLGPRQAQGGADVAPNVDANGALDLFPRRVRQAARERRGGSDDELLLEVCAARFRQLQQLRFRFGEVRLIALPLGDDRFEQKHDVAADSCTPRRPQVPSAPVSRGALGGSGAAASSPPPTTGAHSHPSAAPYIPDRDACVTCIAHALTV